MIRTICIYRQFSRCFIISGRIYRWFGALEPHFVFELTSASLKPLFFYLENVFEIDIVFKRDFICDIEKKKQGLYTGVEIIIPTEWCALWGVKDKMLLMLCHIIHFFLLQIDVFLLHSRTIIIIHILFILRLNHIKTFF